MDGAMAGVWFGLAVVGGMLGLLGAVTVAVRLGTAGGWTFAVVLALSVAGGVQRGLGLGEWPVALVFYVGQSLILGLIVRWVAGKFGRKEEPQAD